MITVIFYINYLFNIFNKKNIEYYSTKLKNIINIKKVL